MGEEKAKVKGENKEEKEEEAKVKGENKEEKEDGGRKSKSEWRK